VSLDDPDARALRLASDLGAGSAARPEADPDVVLVACPPGFVGSVTSDLQRMYVTSTFSDVASGKSYVLADLLVSGGDDVRFVGGHPMAGRERSGPAAAQADLFDGRPWVLTPTQRTDPGGLALVLQMVEACGAIPVVVSPESHDTAVALVSHLPQLVASALAARLQDADEQALALAGQGIRDLTRIADSDPALWRGIVASNASPILDALDGLLVDLETVRSELATAVAATSTAGAAPSARGPGTEPLERHVDMGPDLPAVTRLIERGRAGRARLPGKHGAARVDFSTVQVVIPDRAGELARLLVASGEAGVNVEDVSIEHSPGHPVGLVELSVRPDAVSTLAAALQAQGWAVHV
jgi:prephenate dehydrogenase